VDLAAARYRDMLTRRMCNSSWVLLHGTHTEPERSKACHGTEHYQIWLINACQLCQHTGPAAIVFAQLGPEWTDSREC
jgi:hypothetical protein